MLLRRLGACTAVANATIGSWSRTGARLNPDPWMGTCCAAAIHGSRLKSQATPQLVPKNVRPGFYGRGMTKSTKRDKPSHCCTECGWESVKWVGRCGECQAWGTVIEAGAPKAKSMMPGLVTTAAVPITEVDLRDAAAVPTGLGELDRVLGGGLVTGAVVLLSGEPGVGKSTLLLDVAAKAAQAGSVLYVSGEESASQVRLRADRVGALRDELLLAAETDLGAVLAHIEEVRPKLLIVDSIQTIAAAEVDGAAGGVSQVREVAGVLIRNAKLRGITTILVGHVTKDGTVAGPRMLEHLVDVVVTIEGDRHARLRLVRASKNRFGPADEVGCFELCDEGIRELPDPSELFVTRRDNPVSGTAVTVAMEGTRPLVTEVQALADPTGPGTSRRNTSGLDSSRVAMVLAVLERRAGVGLRSVDTYTATVGGVKVTEPAVDLAIAIAVASALIDKPIPPDTVIIGEVGLAGDVRRVSGMPRRLAEAARLGFTHAIVGGDPGKIPDGIKVFQAADIRSAINAAFTVPQLDLRRRRGAATG